MAVQQANVVPGWRAGRYGPVALVTGASDGIGRAFARELAARGLDLVVVGRNRARLDALAGELVAHGVGVTVVEADLATSEGVQRVIAAADAHDVGLFIAAAGFGSSGPFLDQPAADEIGMVDVNCRAVVALTSAIGRRLAGRGRGGIVLFSSIVAFQGVPRSATYSATKAFVQSFAEGLGSELRPHGVDVVACAPGPIASGFGARANMTMGLTQPPEAVVGPTLRSLGRRTTVRPGWLAALLWSGLGMLPRWGRVMVMGQIMKGMARGARIPT